LAQYFTAQLGADCSTSLTSGPETQGGPPRRIEDFAHFLASRGAVRLEDAEVVSTVGRSINYYINRLEANPFSAPSGVNPALLRHAASKTRAWAETRFGDVAAPHPAQRVTRYLCWETTGVA
jgi:hypothetical protein